MKNYLDYENSEKTSNNMIFKNTTLNIDEELLNKKLVKLEIINSGTNDEIRDYLFEVINSYNG